MSAAPQSAEKNIVRVFAPVLGEKERETLLAWRGELEKLIADRESSFATRHAKAARLLVSTIEGAHQAMLDACEGRRSELREQIARTVAPFHTHAGDATEAARVSPASLAFRDFLRGPCVSETHTLHMLVNAARQSVELLETVLAGPQRELWNFQGVAFST